MLNLSKSKYCGIWQCPKIAWLKKYMPDQFKLDDTVQDRMDEGNEVGDVAMNLFGKFVEVTAYKQDGTIDLSTMVSKTKEELQKGTNIICEASFDYNGLYCAVDILKKDGDGYSIYEVKSSTTSRNNQTKKKPKEVYYADIAYQKYVLEHSGINVINVFLVTINSDYIFDGTLNLDELFNIDIVNDKVAQEIQKVEINIKAAEKLLASDIEPVKELSEDCNHPYLCGFWDYCKKNIPSPSVFNIYGMRFKQKIGLYRQNIITYEDLYKNNCCINNPIRQRQLEFYLQDKGTYIEKENIQEYLKQLSYPLYFLDFETMKSVIPKYIGTRPYQQIPFQYSLHYIEKEGGKLKHKEFLGISGTDPRREIAEQLVRDIPTNVCVTAYNKSFECDRLTELAEAFPDLANHLLNIRDNIVDLIDPFRAGYYYNKLMGGSFSIKSVSPAINPGDPSLDYHNLDEIHNGGEAMTIFPKIKDMTPEQQAITRRNLLKYCELDTLSMVKVWEELVRVSK